MAVKEPMSANDYDDRTTAAVKSVLLEIGQILGSFQGKFAVVGGAVPWLLPNESEMPHIGTIDVDLALDPVALADGESNTEINPITPFWVGQYSTPIVGQFSMPIYTVSSCSLCAATKTFRRCSSESCAICSPKT